MRAFAAKFRALRQSRGLSQRELAELLRIHVMQVNRYERGLSTPSAATIVQIARLFHVTADELLANETTVLPMPEIRDVRLLERLRILDDMPKEEREVVVHVIDAIVAKHRVATALQGAETTPGGRR